MSTPQRQTFAVKKLSDRALGYGMPGYEVDGNDMVACYEAATKAVQAARQGKGPSFIVANTTVFTATWKATPRPTALRAR